MLSSNAGKHRRKGRQSQQKVKPPPLSHRRQTCYINPVHSIIRTKALPEHYPVMSQKPKKQRTWDVSPATKSMRRNRRVYKKPTTVREGRLTGSWESHWRQTETKGFCHSLPRLNYSKIIRLIELHAFKRFYYRSELLTEQKDIL